MPLLMWYSGIMKAGGQECDFRERERRSLCLRLSFRFCLLSFVLHIYILLISAEVLTSALFVVNQLTAEILLHVIHSIGGLPKTPERYKNVSAIVGAFLFPESR